MPYFYGATSTNAFYLITKDNLDYTPNRDKSIAYEIIAHRGGLIGLKTTGKLDGLHYKLDINSAYPYAMLKELPWRYVKTIENISIKEFERLKEKYIGIYDVSFYLEKPVLATRFYSSTILSKGNKSSTLRFRNRYSEKIWNYL
jgi:hypothetical protein